MWLGLLCLAVAGLAVTGVRVYLHKKEVRGLAGRESLSEGAIFLTFYEQHGLVKESVLEAWNEIATTLKLPPDKLRPTDRFGGDIGAPFITSEDLDTLCELAEMRAKRLEIVVNFAGVATVDDYVRALAKKASSEQ